MDEKLKKLALALDDDSVSEAAQVAFLDMLPESRALEVLRIKMEEKLKRLAVALLDDEDGISEAAYAALLDVLPEQVALQLNAEVEATDGRFYLPENHNLSEWAS